MFGICGGGEIAKEHGPFGAVDVGGETDSEGHGKDADEREAGGLGESAPRVAHVTAHFAEVFERDAHGNVGDQADQAGGAAAFGDVLHDVLPELHHFGAVGEFEFVGKGLGEAAVNAPGEVH